jgi:nucleotide-binding universal stress UspA family protein
MTKLLAPLDGSVYSQSVVDYTAWASKRTDASVELLHVLGRRDVASAPANYSGSMNVDARETLLEELAKLDADRARLAQRRGRLILDEAKASLLAAGVTEVKTHLRNGDLVEALQEYEKDCDLVIIGKRGEAADFAKLHLGSNLERVVRSSKKPILVTSRAFKPVNRFLIAFDGGESAMKAVTHIAQGKLFAGMECLLLMVGSETADSRGKLDYAAKRLSDRGYAVEARIEQGQPEAVIAGAIEKDRIDVLVMGAYGHSRIRSLIIGSTTSEMIRSCLVPVMLFR